MEVLISSFNSRERWKIQTSNLRVAMVVFDSAFIIDYESVAFTFFSSWP